MNELSTKQRKTLIKAVLAGDKSTVNKLIHKYKPVLYGLRDKQLYVFDGNKLLLADIQPLQNDFIFMYDDEAMLSGTKGMVIQVPSPETMRKYWIRCGLSKAEIENRLHEVSTIDETIELFYKLFNN